jgi:hypothetical protein
MLLLQLVQTELSAFLSGENHWTNVILDILLSDIELELPGVVVDN